MIEAFFKCTDSIGNGRTGDVLEIKINSNEGYLDLKYIDIYTKKTDILSELSREIKVYKFLLSKEIKCVPQLIYGGVFLTFFCVVTEVVNGSMIKFRKMNESQKQSCMQSLQQLHNNGVLHGDLRSPNFIIKENNECSIIDFGLSKIFKYIDQESKESFEKEMKILKGLVYK